MPQFDAVSFMTQVFWVGVLFVTFYGVVKSQFLPRFAASVKARTKVLRLLENPTPWGEAQTVDQQYSRSVRVIQSHFEKGWSEINTIFDRYVALCQGTTLLSAAAIPTIPFRTKELKGSIPNLGKVKGGKRKGSRRKG